MYNDICTSAMKSMTLRVFFGILLSCVLSNMSLLAQYQLTPECSVEIESNRYVIHFTLPEYSIEEVETECGIYSSIDMGEDVDYDFMDDVGYPILPFFSLDLLAPSCESSDVVVYMTNVVTSSADVLYPIVPALKGSRIVDGVYMLLDDDCYSIDDYAYGYESQDYRDGFFEISGIYNFLSVQGVTFSICPFLYHPESGHIEILQEATFIIEFACDNLNEMMYDLQMSEEYSAYVAQLYFDVFNEIGVFNNSCVNGKYLILAARRDMENALMPYIDYKISQNYETEIIYLDEAGCLGNATRISDIIIQNDVMSNPDYVLLVGSLLDIPPAQGGNNLHDPFSDDAYHEFLGRWILEDEPTGRDYIELRRIVAKTIAAEIGYVDTYSTAVLFSGTDPNSSFMSRSLYRNIKRVAAKSFNPMGIPYTLYDGRDYDARQAVSYMKTALQGNARFFMYTGHGNEVRIGQPYSLHYNDLPICSSPHPIGFGFACSMNAYTTNRNFAARWVAGTNGGVAFFGSTVTTFLSPDNSFAKRIFKELKKLTNKSGNFPLSLWLRISERKYYSALSLPVRGRQIRKYNLIGDPTLAVYGMDGGTYAPFHMPHRNQETLECLDSSASSQIYLMDVYDISGKKIASSTSEQIPPIEGALSAGVYIIKTTYMDGTTSTNKLIK